MSQNDIDNLLQEFTDICDEYHYLTDNDSEAKTFLYKQAKSKLDDISKVISDEGILPDPRYISTIA